MAAKPKPKPSVRRGVKPKQETGKVKIMQTGKTPRRAK